MNRKNRKKGCKWYSSISSHQTIQRPLIQLIYSPFFFDDWFYILHCVQTHTNTVDLSCPVQAGKWCYTVARGMFSGNTSGFFVTTNHFGPVTRKRMFASSKCGWKICRNSEMLSTQQGLSVQKHGSTVRLIRGRCLNNSVINPRSYVCQLGQIFLINGAPTLPPTLAWVLTFFNVFFSGWRTA